MTSEIKFKVILGDDKIPEKIEWNASDSQNPNFEEAKAIALGVWDGKKKQTLRIDLWTKEMSIEEMNHFFVQMLAEMSNTYERATNNFDGVKVLREMTMKFGQEVKVLKE